jgi:serine/threonine protein kinase
MVGRVAYRIAQPLNVVPICIIPPRALMPLSSGFRLGPYEIVAPIGAGGMGEVYRALDTRLDRAVAIKVLTEALAGEPTFANASNAKPESLRR